MESLTRDERIRLVTGKGMWRTKSFDGKIHSLFMTDGPHGLRTQVTNSISDSEAIAATCFPTASALACSFDEELMERLAKALAVEAKERGVDILLGPGINMKRNPLCGRNFEYFSEDPYLAGRLAVAYIRALQDQGVGTSLKHLAGNSQETRRHTSNSMIDERALREIYLSAFEMAVKEAQPATIMSAYNRLNGEYCTENSSLQQQILRDEWGYEGTVISDWGAVVDLGKSIEAGLDLEMPDSLGHHEKELREDLEKGKVYDVSLDRAVSNILKTSETYNNSDSHRSLKTSHVEIAQDIASETLVLLENDGTLPLESPKEVTIIGDLADVLRFQGGGSSHVTTSKLYSAIDSLNRRGIQVNFARGYDQSTFKHDESLIDEAVKLAKDAPYILFFVGLTEITEGEGYDRTSLSLPDNQVKLYYRLLTVNPNIIVVSFGGSPFDMVFKDDALAILHCYLGGEGVGEALVRVLLGEVNPSGKLAETWPFRAEDVPSTNTFAKDTDDIQYRESIFIGYRYFNTFKKPVQYPFGYGLSYTTFSYRDLILSSESYSSGKLEVRCKIKNTGNRAGKEIAQLYVRNPKGTIMRPHMELKGFKKIHLEPGEEKELCFSLEERSFSIYDVKSKSFVIPQGDYEIVIGSSVEEERLSKKIGVFGTEDLQDERKRYDVYFEDPLKVDRQSFQILYGKPLSHFDQVEPGHFTKYHSLHDMKDHSVFARLLLRVIKKVIWRQFKGTHPKDPQVMMLIQGATYGPISMVSLQSDGALPYKLSQAVVDFANKKPLDGLKKLVRFK